MNVFIRELSPWMLISNIITASSEMQEILNYYPTGIVATGLDTFMKKRMMVCCDITYIVFFWSVDFSFYGAQTLCPS